MANRIWLTSRQKEIAILIAKGLSNRDIADELQIVEGTVKNHVSAVYEVLGLDAAQENVRRVRVLIYVLMEGIVPWFDWSDEVKLIQENRGKETMR